MISFRSVALLALFFFQSASYAASFDCSKSKTSVEKAICFDATLSKLDEQMKAEYDRIRGNPLLRSELFNTQRDWRNLVRNPCTTLECLQHAYTIRIEQLRLGDLAGWSADTSLGNAFNTTNSKIEYLTTSANLQAARNWVIKSKLLEAAYSNMSTLTKVRPTLSIVASSCGHANALYSRSKDRIVLCYELVDQLFAAIRSRINKGESTEENEGDRLFKGLEFILMHEFGHAVLHSEKSSAGLGSPETEADNFASVLLIQKYKKMSEQKQLLWGVWTFHNNFAKATYQYEEYAEEHDLPQQRQAKFACNLAGANNSLFSELKSAGILAATTTQAICNTLWARNSSTVSRLSM